MHMTAASAFPDVVVYPDCDGKPMADNTRQLQWIVVLFDNLAALFRAASDVFVSSNQNWYPVEGQPEVCQAPDVYVVFGRPKGHRGSWKQWEEGGVAMTVVFEILSPRNTYEEMDDKQAFYEEHGVEEYYVYNPENNRLKVFLRKGEVFRRVPPVEGFVSPRLGIRFDLSGPEMVVYGPDGERFLTFEEVQAQRQRERQLRLDAERRLARLEELTRKVLQQQATPEERQELERLLEPPRPPSA